MVEEQFLSEEERKNWIEFLENSYKEEKKLAEEIVLKFPRWSIICGYFAMHDLAKLYLAKTHDIKVSGEKTHSRTIFLLKKYIIETEERKRVISLLEEADKEYSILRQGKIHLFLSQGREERTTAQYYLGRDNNMFKQEFSRNASYFLEEIVDVFIKIMEKMACS